MFGGNGFSLGNISILNNFVTRSISAENPDGVKAGGAKSIPQKGNFFGQEKHPARELGQGWKVRPCIPIAAGETVCVADIEGQGLIQHIWMTLDEKHIRDVVLRMYWDGEECPSVEVPIGDFFLNGHGLRYGITSLPIHVCATGGYNSYLPMPFFKSAKITIENQGHEMVKGLFYQITYALGELPPNTGLFHAQWRIGMTTRENPEFILVDGINGNGQYIGTHLAWTQFSDGWWGEGEIKFFIDGDKEFPTICGTGTEDYFGGAWCFKDTYSGPYLGYPLWHREEGRVPKHGMYRWHIMDPIRFEQDLKVTIQALGWWTDFQFQPLTDEIASTVYWYQQEPHTEFPVLPTRVARFPRLERKPAVVR
jgi:hypothetical protein